MLSNAGWIWYSTINLHRTPSPENHSKPADTFFQFSKWIPNQFVMHFKIDQESPSSRRKTEKLAGFGMGRLWTTITKLYKLNAPHQGAVHEHINENLWREKPRASYRAVDAAWCRTSFSRGSDQEAGKEDVSILIQRIWDWGRVERWQVEVIKKLWFFFLSIFILSVFFE